MSTELYAQTQTSYLVCKQGHSAGDWQPVGSLLQQARVVLGDIGEADVVWLHVLARQLRHPPACIRQQVWEDHVLSIMAQRLSLMGQPMESSGLCETNACVCYAPTIVQGALGFAGGIAPQP